MNIDYNELEVARQGLTNNDRKQTGYDWRSELIVEGGEPESPETGDTMQPEEPTDWRSALNTPQTIAAEVVDDVDAGIDNFTPEKEMSVDVEGDEKDVSIFMETVRAVGGGITDAINEGVNFANEYDLVPGIGSWNRTTKVTELLTGTKLPEYEVPRVPGFAPNETTIGQIGRTLTQFAVPYTGGVKALKGIKAATKTASAVKGMGIGFVVDSAFFDPYEKGLLATLNENPELANPVFDFFNTDGDADSVARLKKGLEGAGLGALFDVTLKALGVGAKALKEAGRPVDEFITSLRSASIQQNGFDVFEEAALAKSPNADLALERGADGVDDITVLESKLVESFESVLSSRTELSDDDLQKAFVRELNPDEQVGDVVESLRGKSRKVIDAFGALEARRMQKDIKDTHTWEMVKNEAIALADSPKMMEELENFYRGMHGADTKSFLLNWQALGQAEIIKSMRKHVTKDPKNKELRKAYNKYVEQFYSVAKMSDRVKSEAGRLLNIQKMVDFPVGNIVKAARSGKLTDREVDRLANVIEGAETAQEAAGLKSLGYRAVDGMLRARGRAVDIFNEAYINNMLGGMLTHIVNITSNATNGLLVQPAEYFVKGVWELDRNAMQEAFDMFRYNFAEMGEAAVMAARALKNDKNYLIPEGAVDDLSKQHAIRAESGTIGSPYINALGKAVRAPSRLLMAEDEFFKTTYYRSKVRAAAMREAREMGLKGAEAENHAAKALWDAFDYKNEETWGKALNAKAVSYTNETTFTNALGKSITGNNSLGLTMQQMAQEHPTLRIIMPFIRTPVNLFRFSWQRFPGLGLLQKEHLKAIQSGDKEALARMASKQTTGVMMLGTAAWYASSGMLTGGGPRDTALRKEMEADGWQPYSFKSLSHYDKNNQPVYTWVSYRRGDPVTAYMGLIADIIEIAPRMNEMEGTELLAATVAALTSTLSSKTFLKGTVDTVKAFTDNNPKALARHLRTMAATFATPNYFNQANDDIYRREIRTVVDAIHSRLPGYSETLPLEYNYLGEPVMNHKGHTGSRFNPFPQSYSKNHPLREKMIAIGKGLAPPREKVGGDKDGYNLVNEDYRNPVNNMLPYDRWMQLMGTTTYEGKTFKQTLEELVSSPEWSIAADSSVDFFTNHNDAQYKMARRVYDGYKKVAFHEMLKEYPELKAQVEASKIYRANKLHKGTEYADSEYEKYMQTFADLKKRSKQ